MATRAQKQLSVTWEQATAFRLARHYLSERASKKSLLSVVRDMGGAQAQLLSAAQLSLRPRVNDLRAADVEAALRKRTLVKAACMRRTLFLVPAKDLAVFAQGSARRAEQEIRWSIGKGVPERVVEAAINATLEVLEQPRTRAEIAELVSRKLGVKQQAVHGGGWGSRSKVAAVPVGHLTFPVVDLVGLTMSRGVICYGPNRGSESTFVRADAWIPNWKSVSREEAVRLLLRRYLHAFGPATAEDFAMWSAMSLTEARQAWARAGAAIASVDVEGWQAGVLRKDLADLENAGFERPLVRLLPHFDTFLLGHKEKDHLAAAQHRPKIYRPQGWIAPVVLVDGRAVATWEYARQGGRLRVKVAKFGPISKAVAAGIRAEARDLGRFLGVQNVDVEAG
jgi:uncharacterized protein YcaQ